MHAVTGPVCARTSPSPWRVAVVGSGIAGLAAAHALRGRAHITLFEAGAHFGGHTHTVDVTLEGRTHGVDCGFLVFNRRTYPGLLRLFGELGVPIVGSQMSFSVQVPDRNIEWSGSDLNSVFAQRGNLLRPRFWTMLREIARFNRIATRLARSAATPAMAMPVGDFLAEHRFGAEFRDWYFLPMIGCIWSSPAEQMLRFPLGALLAFCHNHGLLQVSGRPQWLCVRGGARQYVRRIVAGIDEARLRCAARRVRRVPGEGAAGVWIDSERGSERFDEVVLACHADQALALLERPSADERELLGAFGYQRNRAVLHTDAALLPRERRAWAAWNYEGSTDAVRERASLCVHYLINRLQPLPWRTPTIVSLNPAREPERARVIAEFDYVHPVFDRAAIAAQARLPALQGRSHLWFCGAWTGFGFHEDGLVSGQAVAAALRERLALAPARAVA